LILVLSGTGDGRRLVRHLVSRGQKVGVIPLSCYGKELALEDGAIVMEGEISGNNGKWLLENGIDVVVDARHPFTTGNCSCSGDSYAAICKNAGIPFYRIGREETAVGQSELIHPVFSMEQAAERAARLGKRIFLTTGSNGLEPFIRVREQLGVRLVVRVLPEHRVIKKCQDMGIRPKDIVAMQGPFSKQINKALFKMYRASVVVTKDSGKAGGVDTKMAAALALKIPVVLIKREVTGPVLTWQEVLQLVTVNNNHQKDKKCQGDPVAFRSERSTE